MPLKSKINIEVESAQFSETFDLFKKYQSALKKQPGMWAFYHNQIKDVSRAASKLTSFYEEHTASINEAARAHGRFSDAASKAGQIFSRFAHEVKETSGRLASIAGSLFKISLITSVASGLIGGGFGVYVLDRTALDVMERRRAALGLGLGYGQLQSFNTNFSRFGVGQDVLGSVSTGLYDFTSPEYLGLIGGGATGKGGVADTAIAQLRNLPGIFAGVSPGMIGPTAHAKGIDQNFSLNQIVSLLSHPNEIEDQIAKYRADKLIMDIPPDAAEKWANFATATEAAGKTIQSVLATGLEGLADPLTRFSSTISDFIVDVGSDKRILTGIQALESALEWLDTGLGSAQANEYMKKFLSGMTELNKRAGSALTIIAKLSRAGVDVWKLMTEPLNKPGFNPTWGKILKDFIDPFAPQAQEPAPSTGNPEDHSSSGVVPNRGWVPDASPPAHSAGHSVPSLRYGTAGIHASRDHFNSHGIKFHYDRDKHMYVKDQKTSMLDNLRDKHMYVKDQKTSMLDNLRGARTAYAIVVKNETAGSANVSAQRIPIAT